MEHMQLFVLWNQMMSNQSELSRAARTKHVRAERARQARTARPTDMSVLSRARNALSRNPRARVTPDPLASPC